MRIIVAQLLGCVVVTQLIAARDIDPAEQTVELQNHLEYFGNAHILHSILQDYAYNHENWTNPDYAEYDQHVIESLQGYLDVVNGNETQLYDSSVSNGYGVKLLTNFCGPGNWSINGELTPNPYFRDIDQCCKTHDECPYTIVERKDYENFPGLPYKPQLFTRLRCSCDAQFFSCLRDVATFFSYAVAWIYSKVQTYCFEFEYPVIECKQFMYDGLISLPRCTEYLVDNTSPKSWQWFNIPYLSAKQMCFPNVSYRYKIFWFVSSQGKRKGVDKIIKLQHENSSIYN